MSSRLRRPSASTALLESRAVLELGAFAATAPALQLMPRGDGHPVLVLPGLGATDQSTRPLRWFLGTRGYEPHGWELGRSVGPSGRVRKGVEQRLRAIADQRGSTVSIVGWSLGGIYARHLARLHPDAVRQVITLGSPFRFRPGDRSRASGLYDRIHGPGMVPPGMELPEEERPELTVPATAIYSRTDGVVRWHRCIEAEGPMRESIEVRASHSGLGFNPAVLIAVADRLHQREDRWRPFRPPPGTRSLYPAPATWRPDSVSPRT